MASINNHVRRARTIHLFHIDIFTFTRLFDGLFCRFFSFNYTRVFISKGKSFEIFEAGSINYYFSSVSMSDLIKCTDLDSIRRHRVSFFVDKFSFYSEWKKIAFSCFGIAHRKKRYIFFYRNAMKEMIL